ncbi:MAG: DUF1353 domain-containing protein [Roseibium sp.]|uniref:DUF1353 domain-containing protein n=1 Tax=Roseibium sp. TaxID=1936156 RepID=UPI003D9C666C
MRNIIRIFLLLLVSNFPPTSSALASGKFEGSLVLKVTADGRNLQVAEQFSFIDQNGEVWTVPAGMKTDGASVPRVAWSLFPPFAGKYLKAAVVHDRYCDTMQETWQRTHRVFFDAMLTSGVDKLSAKTMYAAVRLFGPRWTEDGTRIKSAKFLSQQEKLNDLLEFQDWILKEDPSIDELEKRADSGQ